MTTTSMTTTTSSRHKLAAEGNGTLLKGYSDKDREGGGDKVKCGKIEHDVDYQSGHSLSVVPRVFSAEDCCGRCLEVPQCKAWTLGFWGGNFSDPSACYLKSAAPVAAEKKAKSGVVYGLPGAPEPEKKRKGPAVGLYKQC